ncbi:uncharacterized protein LOC128554715, partial [Mercenaria mercenaria]|uniref:uncharacterized protein LOC128554715 n=1 Tax=Mercenaria mercenaria TaxID=6596 RepID=UPI00234E97F8
TIREVMLSPTKSRWGVMKNGQFEEKTNFALKLKYSVATSLPSGPGYVVDVVRSADKKTGTAFFLCSQPQKDVHHFVHAIQTSFKVDNKPEDGGFFSTLTKNELLRLVTDLDKELREN